jgi:hypothetical protein
MDHIEVLMRLHEAAGAPVPRAEVERTSRLGPQTVERALADLVRTGLATHDAAADAFRYAPTSPQDEPAVEALSVLYHQRPVTLVKLVYSQPSGPVKSFADAFRLRGREDE